MDGTTETTMLAPPLVAPQRSPGSRHRWALLASVALMGAGAVAVMAAAGGSGADDPELGSREVGPVTSAVDDEPVPATPTATVDSTIDTNALAIGSPSTRRSRRFAPRPP